MDSSEELLLRVESLEETVRILQDENERLADRAEDTLLLGLIAETVAPAQSREQVLRIGLERISILKDIPYCACCSVGEGRAVVVSSSFSAGHEDMGGAEIALPCSLEELHVSEALYFAGAECAPFDIRVSGDSERFAVHSALLIPVVSQGGDRSVFVFADDRPEERLPGLIIVLHRLIDMMVAKIDILELLDSLGRLSEDLMAANRALEGATQAKTDFLANMSHEIRTPMNAILGFAQLLRRDPTLTDEQRERLDIINSSGEFLLVLINDVLDMSKIESGRAIAHPSTFDLHGLLTELDSVFRGRAETKGLRLSVEPHADLPRYVVTDKAKLRQILVNLLSNAVKFTDSGMVRLKALASDGGGGRSLLTFEVEDTGVGIGHDEMKLLFDHFEQTRAGRESGVGTGLGLAISREYARLLGGDIAVRSEEGRGSTFTLTLPAGAGDSQSVVHEAQASPSVTSLAPEQPQFRVLLADDHPEMRRLVSDMLGRLGFEVSAVENGQEAVESFIKSPPDLVLMDARMPVMSGAEAIARIRSAPGGDAVKIIVLTAGSFSDTRESLIATESDGFISKPFTEKELVDMIGELLGAEYLRELPSARRAPQDPSGVQAPKPLPRELVSRLRDATHRADFDAVTELAAEVSAHDQDLADRLLRFAAFYDAEGIIAIVDNLGEV